MIALFMGIIGLVVFQLWASTALSRRALTVSDSMAHRDIAALFASRLSSIGGTSKPEATYKHIRDLAALNPAVRIYLLDEYGIVKVSPEGYGPVKLPFIDMRALRESVAGTDSDEVLYGDDPLDLRTKNPISVAPVFLSGTPHFVYVVLAGSEPNANHSTSATLTVGVMSALFTVLIVLAVGGVILVIMLKRVAGMHSNLTAISHDLRGPLGAVQGYLETLMERGDRLQRSDSLKYMSVALKSTQSAATLVNDLHELSKLESSGETIEKEPFSLPDLVMDVVMSLKPRSEEKGVSLEAACPPEVPLVSGNVQLIERLMRNLAENSLRYTERGGSITVSLHVVAGGVRVLLSDTGCGIPDSDLGDVQK
jgi:signal transduction histidine kinase